MKRRLLLWLAAAFAVLAAGCDSGSDSGAESSSVISLMTERYPLPSDTEGLLVMDRQGYYGPGPTGHNLGLSNLTTAEVLSASLRSPTPWPFPGPDPAGSQAAYTWISGQLCCDDIRAAYVNLNTSAYLWLAALRRLTYDPAVLPNSRRADFDAMVAQLTTEFEYVALVRVFQGNLDGLYQDQQANVSLLLQQAFDDITANMDQDLSVKARPAEWTAILKDAFGILGSGTDLLSLAGPEFPAGGIGTAIHIALAVGALIADQVAAHTNSAAGTPLQAQEKELVAAADLASKAADGFAATFVSLGGEFDRNVSD